MYTVWKYNTMASVLQVLIALGVGMAGGAFDVFWLCGLAIVYVLIAIVAAVIGRLTAFSEFIGAAIIALSIALGGSFDLATVALPLMILYVVFMVIIGLMADGAQKAGAKENFWLLFAVALPLGIGTVIGGVFLFPRGWRHFREFFG